MSRTARLLVFAVPATACSVWTVLAGKDLNWDLLNYHYYLPFELVAGRLGQDFFAASAQSYLNPVGYLPFYLMVSSGWHSVLVSVVLAVAHSTSLALLFLIAWRLFPHLPARQRLFFSCLAAATGGATAVFWVTVGTSFLDPLLAPLVLGGLLLLLEGDGGAPRRAALAGALFGAAAALKYSNAIFAIAAFPLVLAVPRQSRLRVGLGYVAGGIAAFGVLAGPWLALMYRDFANPVFPLMNGWFQSPYAPAFNMAAARFTFDGWGAVLSFPFRMAVLGSSLYSEILAPDIRFAVLAVAALALAAVAAARRLAPLRALGPVDWRCLVFFGSGVFLWLATTANARYGMALLLLAGVCLVRMVERLLPAGVARVALVVMVAVQVGTSIYASPPRWFLADAWSRHWLPFAAPERALRAPALYLTIEVLPMAVVAPFVHPASSFVNVRGQLSIPPDSPRLAELLARHPGRVRALGRDLELVDGRPDENVVRRYDATLLRVGFRLDADDCFTISWKPDSGDPISRAANWLSRTPPTTEQLSPVSCALRPEARDPAQAGRERHFSELFDRIEKACPRIFRGQTAVTEPLGSEWSRNYVGLDARLEGSGENVILNRYRIGASVDLGRTADWERGKVPAVCTD